MAKVVERATSRAVCVAFAEALARFGVPEEVQSDNGKQFTDRFGKGGEVMFDRICRKNGIKHRLTDPFSPNQNGKVERFHGTLRPDFLDQVEPFTSLAAAQTAVDAWVADYNIDRPHQALDDKQPVTPADRFRPVPDEQRQLIELWLPPTPVPAPSSPTPAQPWSSRLRSRCGRRPGCSSWQKSRRPHPRVARRSFGTGQKRWPDRTSAAVTAAMWAGAERLAHAFATGEGVAWADQDPRVFTGVERFFRPLYASSLVPEWLPAVPGLVERLQRGVRVLDVGCGLGSATRLMAETFPASSFLGVDNHEDSIRRAVRAGERAGLTNVRFATGWATDFAGGPYDVITMFDTLHDLGDPVGALRHARASLAADGIVFAVEPGAADQLEENLHPLGLALVRLQHRALRPREPLPGRSCRARRQGGSRADPRGVRRGWIRGVASRGHHAVQPGVRSARLSGCAHLPELGGLALSRAPLCRHCTPSRGCNAANRVRSRPGLPCRAPAVPALEHVVAPDVVPGDHQQDDHDEQQIPGHHPGGEVGLALHPQRQGDDAQPEQLPGRLEEQDGQHLQRVAKPDQGQDRHGDQDAVDDAFHQLPGLVALEQ